MSPNCYAHRSQDLGGGLWVGVRKGTEAVRARAWHAKILSIGPFVLP